MNGLVFVGVPLSFEKNARLRRHIQMIFTLSALFVLTMFVGFRSSSLNTDYDNYSAWYDWIASGIFFPPGFSNDPAFILVSYFFSAIGLGIVGVTVFFAAATLASQFYFSKIAVGQKWIPFLFYLTFCHTFTNTMIAMRAAVAIPLLSSSILLACRGRRKIALLLFITALAFHVSVLIGLLPFILAMLHIRLNSRWWILSFVPATLLARMSLQQFILFMSNSTRTASYAIGLIVGTDPPRAYIAYIAVRILLLATMMMFLWNRITSESRLVLFCYTFAIMIQVVFISNNAVSWRGSEIFGLLDIVALMIPLNFLKGGFCFSYAAGLVVFELAQFQFDLKDLQPYRWVFS